ncbi:hypothetical protein Taro_010995, partial [Colocasia esculenta]|nr:hypothetical protein [Colocasia esculenta]
MAQSKGRNVKKRSSSVDTSPGQVDTRDRSQRNMLTGLHLRSTLNQIKHLKEAEQVEADFCGEFRKILKIRLQSIVQELPEIKALHNSIFYKGVHLKRKAISTILIPFSLLSNSEIVHGLLHKSHEFTLAGLDPLLEDLSLVLFLASCL